MAADYKINLAKDLTSSIEGRVKFYNGMLIYLAICAALLVCVAYLASVNIKTFLDNSREQRQLLATSMAVAGLEADTFKNPSGTYAELESYSRRIASLKRSLGQRVQLLPVIHNLFLDLPENVALLNLAGNKTKLEFGLVMPAPSEQAGDPVKDLREAWESNEELMRRVISIRPTTGERRTIGEESMFFVQFECVLKK